MTPQIDDPRERERLRLEILTRFKQHYQGLGNRSPFHDHQVIQYATDVRPLHVSDIHQDVRERLLAGIRAVREDDASKVVILAGDPGLGKTHLINTLRDPELARKHEYLLVFDSNHWTLPELEEQLLGWILTSLARPTTEGSDVLADKVAFLAFRLLDQVISSPLEVRRLASLTPLQRLRAMLAPKRHSLAALHQAGDVRALRMLRFERLLDRFCDTFLSDSQHLFHRQVVRQLLRYALSPSDREGIRRWLHARGSDSKNEGISPLRRQIEGIRILCSLFSPAVARAFGAASSDPRNRSRVFVFAFDQLEAREAFMQSDGDWVTFFAKMSELYNTLPNVLVLFTLPLRRRKDLLSRMEAQFRDRIGHDDKYLLQPLNADQVEALFHHRMVRWLGDQADDVRRQLASVDAVRLPFGDREDLLRAADHPRATTIRGTLMALDAQFSALLSGTVIEPRLDFLVTRKRLEDARGDIGAERYFQDHLEPLDAVLGAADEALRARWGITLQIERTLLQGVLAEKRIGVRELVFRRADEGSGWVRVVVVVLPRNYRELERHVLELVKGKHRRQEPAVGAEAGADHVGSGHGRAAHAVDGGPRRGAHDRPRAGADAPELRSLPRGSRGRRSAPEHPGGGAAHHVGGHAARFCARPAGAPRAGRAGDDRGGPC